jgi:hypothetical protein
MALPRFLFVFVDETGDTIVRGRLSFLGETSHSDSYAKRLFADGATCGIAQRRFGSHAISWRLISERIQAHDCLEEVPGVLAKKTPLPTKSRKASNLTDSVKNDQRLVATSSATRAANSVTAMLPRSVPPRWRTETAPESASFSPTTRMYGRRRVSASRILYPSF